MKIPYGVPHPRILLILALLVLCTTGVAAYSYGTTYHYGSTYGYGTSLFSGAYRYDRSVSLAGYGYPYPRLPRFNAYETRPSGYNIVGQTTPYPYYAPRSDNHFFLGHQSTWRPGTYYSAMTGQPRTRSYYRTKTNYNPPTSHYNLYGIHYGGY